MLNPAQPCSTLLNPAQPCSTLLNPAQPRSPGAAVVGWASYQTGFGSQLSACGRFGCCQQSIGLRHRQHVVKIRIVNLALAGLCETHDVCKARVPDNLI